MALSDTQLKYYDSNVLRLPNGKRTEYHKQVDSLVNKLETAFQKDLDIKIVKVVKAGSFAKHTILRKMGDYPIDVDVVSYISEQDIDETNLEILNAAILELLLKLYPNKSVEDFEIQKKAATVTFVGTGLSVDIVPVVKDKTQDGYGWQFDSQDGSKIHTCPPCQIKFVQNRKEKDASFRTLVRLAKQWRNFCDVDRLKSFHIELIMAYLLDTQGSNGSIEERFCNFLLYIAQSKLKDQISFPENNRPLGEFNDPVVIYDPFDSNNNVASRITEAERGEIVDAAKKAWETAHFASVENDHKIWKDIFGPRFKTED